MNTPKLNKGIANPKQDTSGNSVIPEVKETVKKEEETSGFEDFDIADASGMAIDKMYGWLEGLIEMLPNIIISVLIMIIFFLISKLIRRLLSRLLDRFSRNKSVNKLVLALTSFAIMLVGMFIALGVLKLDKAVTSLLAGIGVVGLALGFAFQDAASNLIAGVIMAVKSPINIGDIIETNDIFGTVTRIGLRSTGIYVPQGQSVEIPNRLIFEKPFTHYTINNDRRIDLECGISYGDDLEKVEKITLEAIKKIEGLKKGKPVQFFFTEFGDSSINFVIRYWVFYSRQPDYLDARHEGIKNLKKAFDENDITIPFPIRTLDFGIKGGEKLSEMKGKD